MTTREKLGYLKGVIEASDFDSSTKEGKALFAIVDVLDSIVEDIEDAFEEIDIVAEQVDDIDADLTDVEDYLTDCCDGCGDWYEDEDFDDEYEDEAYEVECPYCKESFTVDYETVLDGSAPCPNCGELLDFEVEEYDEEPEKED